MALLTMALAATATGQAGAKAPADSTPADNRPADKAVRGVVWSPSLKPVPDATVTVRAADWSVIKETKTDSSGKFLITGLSALSTYCCATAPGLHLGCELTPTSSLKNPAYVDIKLFAAALIRGVVKDDAGNPVKGAQVIAAFDHAGSLLQPGQLKEATTDEKGYFALSNVPLGDILVRASADGFELSESEVYLRGDREVNVVMKPGKGRELLVIVKGVPKDRLADVRCSLSVRRPYPEPAMALPNRLLQGSLDTNGEWLVTGLPPDVTLSMINVSARGMQFDQDSQTVAPGMNGKVTFKLKSTNAPKSAPELPGNVKNPTLHGVILDEKLRPLSGMPVMVYCMRIGVQNTVTDELGRFACNAKYKPGESVTFSIHNPDWVLLDENASIYWGPSQSVRVEYVTDMVTTLTATPATKFSGKVTASRGVDVAGLLVELEAADPGSGSIGSRTSLGRATTDEDGKFLIEGLPHLKEPAWLVINGMRGIATAGPYKTKKKGKRLVNNVRMKLVKPVMVTGTAVDKKGRPIPGARVRLIEYGGKAAGLSYGGLYTLSDTEGRFAFRGMRPNEYMLQVRIRGAKVAVSSKPFKVGQRRSLDKKLKVTDR
ncbi:MAG: hypothetical protein ACI89X_001336 [Planctomycetota bacterium]|jgi:hypothetical protein